MAVKEAINVTIESPGPNVVVTVESGKSPSDKVKNLEARRIVAMKGITEFGMVVYGFTFAGLLIILSSLRSMFPAFLFFVLAILLLVAFILLVLLDIAFEENRRLAVQERKQ